MSLLPKLVIKPNEQAINANSITIEGANINNSENFCRQSAALTDPLLSHNSAKEVASAQTLLHVRRLEKKLLIMILFLGLFYMGYV